MTNTMISIIVPAYNEENRIRATLERVALHIERSRWRAEVIVVDDGSHDATPETVLEFAKSHAMVRLIQNDRNRGKGFAVKNGMLHAAGDILLFTDADLSSPIEEACQLVAEIVSGKADVAIGSRNAPTALQRRKQPLYRRFLGRSFNILLRLVLSMPYKDTQCGLKAFSRKASDSIFPNLTIEGWAFDPEVLLLARLFKLAVAEIGVAWSHDERSKIHPMRDGLSMLLEVLHMRFKFALGHYSAAVSQACTTPAPSRAPISVKE